MGKTPFQILLAEDNPQDEELVRMALEAHGVPCSLEVMRDGASAIAFIDGLDAGPDGAGLDLCLVDIHLPKQGGEEILKRLRSSRRNAQTPVILMSGTKEPQVEEAARDGGSLFFEKPSNLDEYLQLGSMVQRLLITNVGKT